SGCNFQIKRVWEAVDDCGNNAIHTQTLTVTDTEAPTLVFTNPLLQGAQDGDVITLDCGQANIFDAGDARGTDDCDDNVEIMFMEGSVQNGICTIDGFVTRLTCTWIAKDDCGNEDRISLTMQVEDNQPPVLVNVPGDMTVDSKLDLPNPNNVTATDECDDNITVNFTETETDLAGCQTRITRTWTAEDDCGNSTSATQTITVNGDLSFVVRSTGSDNCNEGVGTASLSPSTYSYSWSDGGSGAIRSNLTEGVYTITATDGTCSATTTITITNECECVPPTINDVATTNASCNGSDGSAEIIVAGNAADYEYIWTPNLGVANATGNSRTNLTAGEYTVVVRAGSLIDCERKVVLRVSSDEAPEITVTDVQSETCDALGSANLLPANLTYNWSDGGTGSSRTDLAGGDYTITATSSAGCETVTTVSIATPTDCGGNGGIVDDGEEEEDKFILPEEEGYSEIVDLSSSRPGGFISDRKAIVSTSCESGATSYCVEIPLQKIGQFTIRDNGQSYRSGYVGCDFSDNATGTRLWLAIGEHELTFTHKDSGESDTLTVNVHCTTPEFFSETLVETEQDTFCIDTDDLLGSAYTITNICKDDLNGKVSFEQIEGTTCVIYDALEEGIDNACFVICDELGVCDTTSLEVTVRSAESTATSIDDETDKPAEVLVYNGFSPNNDGLNDYFNIDGLENYPDHEVKVFNRNGQLIFEATDYQNDWSGTSGLEELPEDTYFYIIDLGNGERITGYLQILR
ncbi:MAG: gliding motility-associated C-terminal domain-containing protein, partial [Saprospiraceae bacterium]